MNKQDFEKLLSEIQEKQRDVLCSKNKEYSTEEDYLKNFKDASLRSGLNPVMVAEMYKEKHIGSIKKIITDLDKGIVPTREVVYEKFGDCLNYLVLQVALLEEFIDNSKKGQVPMDINISDEEILKAYHSLKKREEIKLRWKEYFKELEAINKHNTMRVNDVNFCFKCGSYVSPYKRYCDCGKDMWSLDEYNSKEQQEATTTTDINTGGASAVMCAKCQRLNIPTLDKRKYCGEDLWQDKYDEKTTNQCDKCIVGNIGTNKNMPNYWNEQMRFYNKRIYCKKLCLSKQNIPTEDDIINGLCKG